MAERRAKRKAKGTSRASKPGKLASKSGSKPAKRVGARAGGKAPSRGAANRAAGEAASRLIDERIRTLGGWRGETLAEVRRIIREADPEMVEECKWIKATNPSGVPVWSHDGIVCTGEAYKEVVKLTFGRGAFLSDPGGLFNSSLEGNTRRAIDIREGETIDAEGLAALIRAAVAENVRRARKANSPRKGRGMAGAGSVDGRGAGPAEGQQGKPAVRLLSGGNPQIAKADGDAPVQAYIAAMPGWKSGLGKRLDALIVRTVPEVRKAVRWNSPFYGIEGRGWFLSIHVLTRYVKVTFFAGLSLRPIPPGGTPKSQESRWIDIYEDDSLDEQQMASWFKQAAALPAWIP
jgi:hypothetical protein